MSDTSNFLTIGCTALVLMMLDKGASVGGAMALDDPLAAIRDLDTDPTWQKPLPLKCGTEMNAIQIQEHYLAACEAFVKNDPQPWPHEVVKRWRDVLNRLKKDPRMLATILDPYIKWVWYAGALRDHGLTFKQFSIWSSVLSLIRPHLSEGWIPRRSTKEWLRDQMPFVPFHLLEERLARHRLSWPDVPRALNVWNSLVALDLKYHSIFESGPFWTFRKTVPEAQLMCQAEIERAKSAPPAGTRAVRRSAAIREVSRDRKEAFANWTTVVDSSRSLDLSDPFKTDSSWQTARKTGVTK